MRQERSQVHDGHAEMQRCAELYRFLSHACQMELRLYVCGVVSQSETLRVIANLQGMPISLEDFKRRII